MPLAASVFDRSAAVVHAAGVVLRRRFPGEWRFLLLRGSGRGEWGFAKGHCDPGEDLATTARRECLEECGLDPQLEPTIPQELLYHLPDGRLKRVAYFSATSDQGEVVLSDEHDRHRWVDAAETRAMLPHRGLRRLFDRHLAGLPPC